MILNRKRLKHILHGQEGGNDRLEMVINQAADTLKKDKAIITPHLNLSQLSDKDDETVRNATIFLRDHLKLVTLSNQEHDGKRTLLKEAYERRGLVTWEASVSNLAQHYNKTQHRRQGFILLNKIHLVNPNGPMYFAYANQYNLIDYHLWLAVDNIKYFGNKPLDLAQGDIIRGISRVKKYNNNSYTLGQTVITNAGFMYGDSATNDIIGIRAINGRIKQYDHDDYLIKLMYSPTYAVKFQRYNQLSIENLLNLDGHVGFKYHLDSQDDYAERFKSNALDKLSSLMHQNDTLKLLLD